MNAKPKSSTKSGRVRPNPPEKKGVLRALARLPFFGFWMPVVLVFTALASVPGIYSSLPGVTLQQGVLVVTTLRACLNWLVSLSLFVIAVALLIRKRKMFFKQYPMFLYIICWISAFGLPVTLLASFDTPNVSYDLARYYVAGTIDERQTRISSVEQICSNGKTTVCTLWVDMEDGGRYSTRGTLAEAIKQHGEIEAVRVLPRSGRLVGIRTKDGWL